MDSPSKGLENNNNNNNNDNVHIIHEIDKFDIIIVLAPFFIGLDVGLGFEFYNNIKMNLNAMPVLSFVLFSLKNFNLYKPAFKKFFL